METTYYQAYYARNKGRYRAVQMRRLYDVSLVWFLSQYAHQSGKCAVCRQPCTSGQQLSVDHDHRTGKVRGLLCKGCNLAIGNASENADTLRRLADYLEA